MADNVVAINGVPLSSASANENLVKFLEDSLEKAKSGEIIGMVGAIVYPSGTGYVMPSNWFVSGDRDCFSALGALEMAKHCLVEEMS